MIFFHNICVAIQEFYFDLKAKFCVNEWIENDWKIILNVLLLNLNTINRDLEESFP